MLRGARVAQRSRDQRALAGLHGVRVLFGLHAVPRQRLHDVRRGGHLADAGNADREVLCRLAVSLLAPEVTHVSGAAVTGTATAARHPTDHQRLGPNVEFLAAELQMRHSVVGEATGNLARPHVDGRCRVGPGRVGLGCLQDIDGMWVGVQPLLTVGEHAEEVSSPLLHRLIGVHDVPGVGGDLVRRFVPEGLRATMEHRHRSRTLGKAGGAEPRNRGASGSVQFRRQVEFGVTTEDAGPCLCDRRPLLGVLGTLRLDDPLLLDVVLEDQCRSLGVKIR